MKEKKFKFEKLQVWEIAMDYGEKINQLSQKFPANEKYNLVTQINRAVDSIALNISEGATGNSNPEFNKFLGYSIRSIAEVITFSTRPTEEIIFQKRNLTRYMMKLLL